MRSIFVVCRIVHNLQFKCNTKGISKWAWTGNWYGMDWSYVSWGRHLQLKCIQSDLSLAKYWYHNDFNQNSRLCVTLQRQHYMRNRMVNTAAEIAHGAYVRTQNRISWQSVRWLSKAVLRSRLPLKERMIVDRQISSLLNSARDQCLGTLHTL